MKKKLLFLLLFSINSYIYSQHVCGTSTVASSAAKKTFTVSELAAAQSASYCINVYFHIVRDNSGNGGIQVNQLSSIINNLNQFYNSHNIYFVNAGYDFINNTNYQQIDNKQESENLAQTNNLSNSINYYIVDRLWNTPEGFIAGTAISIPSNRLVIRKDYALSEVSSHEMGHCLNLWHTFQGTKPNTDGCAEAINGSNCYSCGDQVCDTPADADSYNNNGYNPDLTNIMSYYPFTDHFTPDQGLRMRSAINSFQLLRNTISTSCSIPTLTGSAQFCSNTAGSTYTLQNGGNSVAWQVSPNLQILSSDNTSITVKPSDSWVVSEAGYIDAILPYQTIRDSVWIGVPYINYNSNEDFTMCRDLSTTENNFFRATIKGQDLYTTWEIESITDNHYASMQGDEILISLNFAPPFNYVAFKVRASNSCGFSEWLQYYVAVISSCENGGSSSFVVYPNPVSSVLNIQESQESLFQRKSGNDILELKLYDDTGNLKTERKTNKFSELDMTNLKNGYYFLQLIKNGQLETHKIIKN
ncbi:zinc-dependent metalloprotease [Flavobacterium pectinovorum]|uniref:Por secretion system C-terminal sorting domain-containing protein n=1 Tax=Flavobacterium pectinovorum TaxID=29533 RepID=A0AB36P6A6_9FLAO|nr:T9SS type A sorting domain-containing protein [Flavobacterium pectinovorum]OXB07904.1 hypothetical protein B0A72_03330 [Flavobacterium pectinovorum]SHM84004.1 Por secretion system C-terminal sorting domain-containing protein [Flavobacterium pectinovorum]